MSDRHNAEQASVALCDDAHELNVVSAFVGNPEEFVERYGADFNPNLMVAARAKTLMLAALNVHERGALNHHTLLEKLREWNALEDAGGNDAVSSLIDKHACSVSTAGLEIAILRDRAAIRIGAVATSGLLGLTQDRLTAPHQVVTFLRETVAQIEEAQSGRRRDALPEIEDAADLLALPLEAPPEVIVGLLHQRMKMVIGGGSKSYKTWLLLHLAYAVATGTDWLGFSTRAGRVLYVNLEIDTVFFGERLKAISQTCGGAVPKGRLDLWNLRGHAADLSKMLPQMLERVGRNYALIIIDPIYKVLGDRDENAAGDITGLLNELERLAVQSGAAVVFGAHFSKGNQSGKEAMDRIGGSGVYGRDPDAILTLTRHEEDGAFTVESTLRNLAPVDPFVTRWNFPLMERDGSLDPAKLKQVQGRPKLHDADELLNFLGEDEKTYGEWFGTAKEHAGMSKGTFSALKCELMRNGRAAQSKLNQKYLKVRKVNK